MSRAQYFGAVKDDGYPTPIKIHPLQNGGEVLEYKTSFVAHCAECEWYRKKLTLRSAISAVIGHYQMAEAHGGRWSTFFRE